MRRNFLGVKTKSYRLLFCYRTGLGAHVELAIGAAALDQGGEILHGDVVGQNVHAEPDCVLGADVGGDCHAFGELDGVGVGHEGEQKHLDSSVQA